MNAQIQNISTENAKEVATMVGELLTEIMNSIHIQAFNFDLDQTTERLNNFINHEKYFGFVSFDDTNYATGFITLYESYALYAEGSYGNIPELYVRPEYRSNNVGRQLISHAKSFSLSKGWKRLEVTTPPIPQFEKTVKFYEREGFEITGGRKLKINL